MSISADDKHQADNHPPRTANDWLFLAVASVLMAVLAVSAAAISFDRYAVDHAAAAGRTTVPFRTLGTP